MEFRILGPLELAEAGRPLPLGRGKQKALLALLLLHANEPVSADRLIDELWGETPPPTAQNALQNYVSRLRKQLGPERLLTRPPGYLLRLEPDELDLHRFEALLAQARASQEPAATAAALAQALALWRGPALADFAFEPFAQGEIVRLEDLRLAALEERLEAELALGRSGELVGELEALVAEHPLRERFRAQLMLALYRAGRQAEALEAYQAARATLVEEIGIEPGEELRELQRRMLEQDPGLALARPAAPEPLPTEPEPQREQRKTVTVLCCDLGGSARDESVDPELIKPYFERAAQVIADHGGTVEALIGETITAVFGVPTLHEDDALRALRAAQELPGALAALATNRRGSSVPELRIGVSTGEVVAAGGSVVTGDAFHVAARLANNAPANGVLFGDATWHLVRDRVAAEPGEVELKGKVKPLRAWRLASILRERPPLTQDEKAPFVGRERELHKLREAFEETVHVSTPHLFTLLGPAGIGKTRLAGEFASEIDRARLLAGRCLPYGEGITYWPLVEIVRKLGTDVRAAVSEALRGDSDAEPVGNTLAGLAGELQAAAGQEEIFWSTRRLFESIARQHPLVLVFEDIHWAEPTLLELIEYVADVARTSAIFILCLARLELLDEHPGWAGGKVNATSLLLEPLSPSDSDALIDLLLGGAPLVPAARRQIAEAAEGNPLFVEQMLALLGSEERVSEAAELAVPPTIQAVLAARLDRLGPAERAVVEAAAVIGKEFPLAAVGELLPDDAGGSLSPHAAALVRKELIRPYRSSAGRDDFRFRHILIRDAAYRGIPKARRAELHERFASWLEHDRSEHEEFLGYHLEQAHTYRTELGAGDAETEALAARAGAALLVAGGRAADRSDNRAAVALLTRAAALLPANDPAQPRLQLDLARALVEVGEFVRAEAPLRALVDGERDAVLRAEAEVELVVIAFTLGVAREGFDEITERALSVIQRSGSDAALSRALQHRAVLENERGQWGIATRTLQRALGHAARARHSTSLGRIALALGTMITAGPTPVSEGIDYLEQVRRTVPLDRFGREILLMRLGLLRAYSGDVDDGRALVEQGRATLSEMGLRFHHACTSQNAAEVEVLAEDLGAAEKHLREGLAELEQIRDRGYCFPTIAALLAHVLCDQGRFDEAGRAVASAREAMAADDVYSLVLVQSAAARVAVYEGALDEAIELAQAAARAVATTDGLDTRARAASVLASTLEAADRPTEALAAAEEALRLYEQKEAVAYVDRTRPLVARLAAVEASRTSRRNLESGTAR